MARPERFELPTTWFVARYSIQLSYGRVAQFEGRRLYWFRREKCPGVSGCCPALASGQAASAYSSAQSRDFPRKNPISERVPTLAHAVQSN